MEDFAELIINRRSIRKFKDTTLSSELIPTILQAGLLAPSSKRSQPWEFFVVDDKKKLVELSEFKPAFGKFIAESSFSVVVCGDSKKSDVWVEDCSIAATMMLFQAEDLGLGTCWCQVRKREGKDGLDAETNVRRILDISSDLNVLCVLSFGVKDEFKKPFDLNRLKWEKVHIKEDESDNK